MKHCVGGMDEPQLVSLPTWECGLKTRHEDVSGAGKPSLPTWECGLKLKNMGYKVMKSVSLPTWECGLKLNTIYYVFGLGGHSPRGSVD